MIFGMDDNDTFTADGIESFVKYFNYKPLAFLNASETDNDEAKLNERALPVVHLWLDDAVQHTETMKTVRTAAVQLQRKASFVYHDMKRDGGKPGYVEDGTRKMLLNYALDGAQTPLMGLDGKG